MLDFLPPEIYQNFAKVCIAMNAMKRFWMLYNLHIKLWLQSVLLLKLSLIKRHFINFLKSEKPNTKYLIISQSYYRVIKFLIIKLLSLNTLNSIQKRCLSLKMKYNLNQFFNRYNSFKVMNNNIFSQINGNFRQ